jgi:hypothetical protein
VRVQPSRGTLQNVSWAVIAVRAVADLVATSGARGLFVCCNAREN